MPLEANENYFERNGYAPSDTSGKRLLGRSCGLDAVLGAFDEVVRLARLDGEQRAAALFEYRQAGFGRLVDAEDERATEGDWERDPAPYASWA